MCIIVDPYRTIGTDTMENLNHRPLLAEDNIIPMGQLVKKMLMVHDCAPLTQVQRLQYEAIDDPSGIIGIKHRCHEKRVFSVMGSFRGFIASTGPSTRAIVAKMDAVSIWSKALLDKFRNDLASANFESDTLLGAILDSDSATLDNACFSHVSNVRWQPNPAWSRLSITNPIFRELMSDTMRRLQTPQVVDSKETISQLIQLKGIDHKRLRMKMGIASPQARPGDLLCSIPGIRHCVTVRPTDENFQIFGTSLLVKDVDGVPTNYEKEILQLQRGDRGGLDYDDKHQQLEIRMDARTLFVLLP